MPITLLSPLSLGGDEQICVFLFVFKDRFS